MNYEHTLWNDLYIPTRKNANAPLGCLITAGQLFRLRESCGIVHVALQPMKQQKILWMV